MKNIFVVDDSEEIRKIIKKVFSKNGTNVYESETGIDAFQNILKLQPELVILDLKIPGKSGLDVLKDIRNDPRTMSIPVIILTGSGEDEKIECFEIGADDYIKKPVDLNELLLKVRNTIMRHNMAKALHPLTQMPAAPMIERIARDKIEKKEEFVYMYIDIDNFKKYNDLFGYVNGDRIIKLLSTILKDMYDKYTYDYFAGHIGGDDFVIICGWDNWYNISHEIAEKFDEQSKSIKEELLKYFKYSDIDLLPDLRLSIVAVSNVMRNISNYGKLVEISFELKKYLKSFKNKEKSMVFMDRRRDKDSL